jgi:hypothetical protein
MILIPWSHYIYDYICTIYDYDFKAILSKPVLPGSFGVAEDQFFKKATEYARQRGLPRVYIACNSGARVGLVDEIIPKLQVQWKDASDPSKVHGMFKGSHIM